jgi:hypothetical protein
MRIIFIYFLVFSCGIGSQAASFYVSPSGANTPPYADWASAATAIQSAIEAASAGDIVWVTNGTYMLGGKVMSGMTNRVALDKALTVQSVNGPAVTIVRGATHNGTNGPTALRCAALTTNATLSGFTLCGGATVLGLQGNGGGVAGAFGKGLVTNCLIISNTAASTGGGAISVTLRNCTVKGNSSANDGGGTASCTLENCFISSNVAAHNGGGSDHSTSRNCAITGNSAGTAGGGDYGGKLVNCTVTGNKVGNVSGGGVYGSSLTNSIVYQNSATGPQTNHGSSTFEYCCTVPLPAGLGNTNADPQLLDDGIHLSNASPCRGAGTNTVLVGTDIDDQPWANPPSIGCDEWMPIPVIARQPKTEIVVGPLAVNIGRAVVAGQGPFVFSWSKESQILEDDAHYSGVHTTNLMINNFGLPDTGNYQIIASNAFGMATSAVVRLVIHCVTISNTAPIAPYTDWTTAATNIQDAIDVSEVEDFVLVTNGVYASGGPTATPTGRIVIPKPIVVASVNGASKTIIQGAWDPVSTNGPQALRCAMLMAGSTLSGFTLQGGATPNIGSLQLQAGGGVLASSTNELILNCVIMSNSAAYAGGGVFGGTVRNCYLVGNQSTNGGGAASSTLVNCYVQGNTAQNGGGAQSGTIINCTVVSNFARTGGGTDRTVGRNSIVYFNTSVTGGGLFPNYSAPPPDFKYCCTTIGVGGEGMIYAPPQLIDGLHLTSTSPCWHAGSSLYASDKDFDGEPWINPPSIGCDELWESAVTGPLTVGVTPGLPEVAARGSMTLTGTVNGRTTRVAWDFGDGSNLTNTSYLVTSHIWTNAGDYVVTFTAYNADYPNGVSTNLLTHVVPLDPPLLFVSRTSATGLSLTFTGQPGVKYFVDQATNLQAPVLWQNVQSVSGTGILQIIDSTLNNESKFYRVRVP